ncbi:unnamed protein product [Ambrosiozyma monospora]|uniref:Unnamed protein product n=1 Tax=Ambrosiozyma monospora TaxID=43982 RepID=A0ACB5SZY1_AMBMO|nr:unnamed protein product [Ambrosiozyma monospora]
MDSSSTSSESGFEKNNSGQKTQGYMLPSTIESLNHCDVNKVGSLLYLYTIVFIICLCGLMFGYDTGTLGGLIDLTSFKEAFGDEYLEYTDRFEVEMKFKDLTKGILISASSLGGFFGGGITMIICNPLGPKIPIFIAAVFHIAGATLELFSGAWFEVAIGRTLIGMSIGMFCVACPMLISDLAPTNVRGTLVSIFQLMVTVGIMIGAITLYCFEKNIPHTSALQFAGPMMVSFSLGVLMAILIWLVPNSPVWYFRKYGNIEDTIKLIAEVRCLKEDDPSVIKVAQLIYEDVQNEKRESSGNQGNQSSDQASIIKGQPMFLLRTFTGVLLFVFQQCSGINYFFFFGTSIFASVIDDAYLVPIFFASINLLFSILASTYVDEFKRTTLLKIGSIALGSIIGVFAVIKLLDFNNTATNVSMIILSCSFIAIFAFTWGPVANIVVSELFPPSIKVKAMSTSGCSGWVAGFLVTTITPLISKYIGFAFMIIMGLSAFFVKKYVPDTRNLQINELNDVYRKFQNKS